MSIILTSILAEPGRIDRDGDMIGYNATMKVGGCEYKIDSFDVGYHELGCPFSIIDEFDQWFEWWRRVAFDGESRFGVTVDMLGMVKAVSRRIERELLTKCVCTQAVGILDGLEADSKRDDRLRFVVDQRFGELITPRSNSVFFNE